MYLSFLKRYKSKSTFLLKEKEREYFLNCSKEFPIGDISTYNLTNLRKHMSYFPNSIFFRLYFKKAKFSKKYFKSNTIKNYYTYTIKRAHSVYFKYSNNLLNFYSQQKYCLLAEKNYSQCFLQNEQENFPHWLVMYIIKNYRLRLWRNVNEFYNSLSGLRYIIDFKMNEILFYWYKYKYYLKAPFRKYLLLKISFFFKYVALSFFIKKGYFFTMSKFFNFFKDYFLSLFIMKSLNFSFLLKKLHILNIFKRTKYETFYLFLLYRFSNFSLENFNIYIWKRNWSKQNLPMFAQMSLVYNFTQYRGVFIVIGKYFETTMSMTFSGYKTPYIVTKDRKSFWRDMTACFSLYSYTYFDINSNIGYLMYPHLIKLNLFRNIFINIGWSVATKIILGQKLTYNRFSYYYLNSKSLLISNFYFNGVQALGNISNYFNNFFSNYQDYKYDNLSKNFLKKKKPISMHRQEITSMRWIRENIKSFFIEKYKRAWFITRFCKYYEKSLTAGIQNLIWIEMRLSTILIRCKIVYLLEDSYDLIKEGCVFVNGKVCKNVAYIVKLHDRIQFILSKSLHLQHRELLSNVLVKYKRLPAYVYSRFSGKNRFEMVHRDTSARWPLKALWIKNDIPRYLEVDYITMTIFVLYYPLYLKDIFPYYYLHIKFLSARCYNWRFFH